MSREAPSVVFLSGIRTPLFRSFPEDLSCGENWMGALVCSEALQRAEITPEDVSFTICSGSCLETRKLESFKTIWGSFSPFFQVYHQTMSALYSLAFSSPYLCNKKGVLLLFSETPINLFQRGLVSFWQRLLPSSEEEGKQETPLVPFLHPWEEIVGRQAKQLIEEFKISREELDKYTLHSHRLAWQSWDEQRLSEDMVSLFFPPFYEQWIERDENPKEHLSLDYLASLPSWQEDSQVTLGHFALPCYGASSLCLSTLEFARERALLPLAYLVDWEVSSSPSVFHFPGLVSLFRLLCRHRLTPQEIDLLVFYESSAALGVVYQKLLFSKQLQKIYLGDSLGEFGDSVLYNPRGGSLAFGFTFQGVFLELTVELIWGLKRSQGRWGALVFEDLFGEGGALLIQRDESCRE